MRWRRKTQKKKKSPDSGDQPVAIEMVEIGDSVGAEPVDLLEQVWSSSIKRQQPSEAETRTIERSLAETEAEILSRSPGIDVSDTIPKRDGGVRRRRTQKRRRRRSKRLKSRRRRYARRKSRRRRNRSG